MGKDETAPTTQAVGGCLGAPLAHRRPGHPSVGLLASRARLRFARQTEGSAAKGRSKAAEARKRSQAFNGRGDGAMAASRRQRQDAPVAPDGPGLPVLLVKVRVP